MITVRPFKKEDLTAFVPIEPIEQECDDEFAQAIEDSGLAVTGVRDGEVVGCGGVHPVDDFHGEMWMRLSKDCLNYKVSTLRWIKCGMEIIEDTYPFKQLNAAIRCTFKESVRLIKYLGFVMTEEKIFNNEKWLVFSKRLK